MISRLLFFCVVLFLGLAGCINNRPKPVYARNTDPCDASGGHQLTKFTSLTSKSGAITIDMTMLLPCEGSGRNITYSLAFYNADNLVQPSDATNASFSGWNVFTRASCTDPSANQKVIDSKIKINPDFDAVSKGSAVTLGVGNKHPNRLYPYFVKVSYENGVSGQPSASGEGSCTQGVDQTMRPFVPDPNTLSPVYQKGNPVTIETGESGLAIGSSYTLYGAGSPFFTYGTKIQPAGSEEGIKSVVDDSVGGSRFTFDVKLIPGRYYVVLSLVPKPAAAISGTFSLANVKIYGASGTNKILDYLTDCDKDISCGGKATAVRVA